MSKKTVKPWDKYELKNKRCESCDFKWCDWNKFGSTDLFVLVQLEDGEEELLRFEATSIKAKVGDKVTFNIRRDFRVKIKGMRGWTESEYRFMEETVTVLGISDNLWAFEITPCRSKLAEEV